MIFTRLPLLLLSMFFIGTAAAQNTSGNSGVGYVRIQLGDITTTDQEVEVDDFIRAKAGVLMSRTDHNTDTYYAHFDRASGIAETDFLSWLQALGIQTYCMVSGNRDGEPVKDFPKNCKEQKQDTETRTH